MGLREGQKPCEWIYLTSGTLKLLENAKLLGKRIRRELVSR